MISGKLLDGFYVLYGNAIIGATLVSSSSICDLDIGMVVG